jgi:hypothetical protein
MTPREKAESAQRLLDEPVFKTVLVDIKDRLVSQLETVAISDKETQHEITLMLQLLKRIPSELQRYIQDQALENAKAKQQSWIENARERLT